MSRPFRRLLDAARDPSGAASAEWVVIAAAVALLAGLILFPVGDGAAALMGRVSANLFTLGRIAVGAGG